MEKLVVASLAPSTPSLMRSDRPSSSIEGANPSSLSGQIRIHTGLYTYEWVGHTSSNILSSVGISDNWGMSPSKLS